MIRKIDTNSFQDAIDRDLTTIVKFEADWCVPCKEITPSVELLSEEWSGRNVEFVSLDIDGASTITQKYNIFGVPTFIAFRNGEPVSEVRSKVNVGNLKSTFSSHIV